MIPKSSGFAVQGLGLVGGGGGPADGQCPTMLKRAMQSRVQVEAARQLKYQSGAAFGA